MSKYLKSLKPAYSKFLESKREFKNNIFGSKDYNKYVVISRSRTGSTLLMVLLDKHSNIQCEGELFKVLNGKSCKQVWDSFFSKKPRRIIQAGFKLFYYHPFDYDKSVWEYIKEDKSISIVHLVRHNLLEAYTSQKIGEKTKKWTENIDRTHNFALNDKVVHLDYEDCLDTFKKIKSFEEKTRNDFSDRNYIEVSYEDLISNRKKTMTNVYSSLGLVFESIETVMKKQNPEPLSNLIENYHELKKQFSNTEWEYLFK